MEMEMTMTTISESVGRQPGEAHVTDVIGEGVTGRGAWVGQKGGRGTVDDGVGGETGVGDETAPGGGGGDHVQGRGRGLENGPEEGQGGGGGEEPRHRGGTVWYGMV